MTDVALVYAKPGGQLRLRNLARQSADFIHISLGQSGAMVGHVTVGLVGKGL